MTIYYPHYHGQYLEDRRIRMLVTDLPEIGVFVEVGAGEPITWNNTYHFERNGWRGLLIDPDPRRCEELRCWRQAPVEQLAIAPQTGELPLHLSNWPGLSTCLGELPAHEQAGTIVVACSPLETVLRRRGITEIDLLSIDTEGTELDVWASFDWQVHRPRVVLIEWATIHLSSRLAEIRRKFNSLPYREICLTGSNLIFLLEESVAKSPTARQETDSHIR
jgi:FkbM family methyltransferase